MRKPQSAIPGGAVTHAPGLEIIRSECTAGSGGADGVQWLLLFGNALGNSVISGPTLAHNGYRGRHQT